MDLQTGYGSLQKEVEMWSQRYASASTVLQDLEKKISALEHEISDQKKKVIDLPELEPDEYSSGIEGVENSMQERRERLIDLHRKLSRFLQRTEGQHEGDIEDDRGAVDMKAIEGLETRIRRVESDAISNMRYTMNQNLFVDTNMHYTALVQDCGFSLLTLTN
jgi:chromosome segregation ATPase